MNRDGASSSSAREVTIQLLDPTYRRPLRTWQFQDKAQITIGRGDEVDVEVSDAYVSRVHAEILFRDDRWLLVARGRNGVMVGSESVTELSITGEVTFRLGSAGPLLRFSPTVGTVAASATLCYAADASPLLRLDETKLHEEVAAIASDDYFQKLQQKVKELRRQRPN